MERKFVFLVFGTILLVGLSLHLVPMLDNNFYFTMDQGNEAVHAREIWYRHQLVLTGPETSIPGLFNGPFWHWFIAIGYWIFKGHPFGALILLVFVNLILSAFLMWRVFKYVSFWSAIILGLALQFFWPFYDTSRYAFSPFGLVACTIMFVLLMEAFLARKKKSYRFAGIPVAFASHVEIASFPPIFLLYVLMGVWGLFTKRFTRRKLVAGIVIVLIFFLPQIISEITTNFSQFWSVQRHLSSERTVLAASQFIEMSQIFIKLIGESVVPQKPYIGTVVFLFVFIFFIKNHSHNVFIKRFILLSLLLIAISWIWFSSNIGWHPWHTVYVAPLSFIALLLMFFSLPRKIGAIFISAVLIFQFIFFAERYVDTLRSSKDPSLLKNEIQVIDWVYQKAKGKGFYAYTYLPSVYDYPYQYLFWWYGRKKYGYLPCEYSTYPNVPDLFVPGLEHYQNPKRTCGKIRFLIVEPYKSLALQKEWLQGTREGTSLIEEITIGAIKIEKRLPNP